jgi:hypothetical protein
VRAVGKFLENEKIHYTALMPHTQIVDGKAKTPGLYKGKLRQFCLPQVCSDENLFDGIREVLKSILGSMKSNGRSHNNR